MEQVRTRHLLALLAGLKVGHACGSDREVSAKSEKAAATFNVTLTDGAVLLIEALWEKENWVFLLSVSVLTGMSELTTY